MRMFVLAAAAALVAMPALAQPMHRHGDRHSMSRQSRSPGPPVDQGGRGNSDAAYAGGGLVLEGAPGAPAPMPMQTAPAGSLRPQGAAGPARVVEPMMR